MNTVKQIKAIWLHQMVGGLPFPKKNIPKEDFHLHPFRKAPGIGLLRCSRWANASGHTRQVR